MRKLFALLLAAMMVVSMTACGQKEAPAPSDTPAADADVETGVVANPKYPDNGTINAVIGWSAGGTTDLVLREL